MFIEASALTAILTEEAGYQSILVRLRQATNRITSPLAVWETAVAISRVLDLAITRASDVVHDYLELASIQLHAIPPEAGALALDAFDRYGKGRHPAQLNMGDCFAYACARHLGMPLMYNGDDFPQTDIEAG